MPTVVHELFIAGVEDAIFSQLKSIREGSNHAAAFAQKVYPARSTEICLSVDGAPMRKVVVAGIPASTWSLQVLCIEVASQPMADGFFPVAGASWQKWRDLLD
jgi:hypothetical protein